MFICALLLITLETLLTEELTGSHVRVQEAEQIEVHLTAVTVKMFMLP